MGNLVDVKHSSVAEGNSDADMIQDLNNLYIIGKENMTDTGCFNQVAHSLKHRGLNIESEKWVKQWENEI